MLIHGFENKSAQPAFGLKITDNAAVSIINQYKKIGATDSEIVYYLKKLKASQPDSFELQKVDIEQEVKHSDKGDNLSLRTVMWFSDGIKSGEFITPRTYSYEDYAGGKYSAAETKDFYFLHLQKAVSKAVNRIKHGSVTPSLIQRYSKIIQKADL